MTGTVDYSPFKEIAKCPLRLSPNTPSYPPHTTRDRNSDEQLLSDQFYKYSIHHMGEICFEICLNWGCILDDVALLKRSGEIF